MADNDTSVGLYSDRVHIVWIVLTSQLFSHLWCPKPLGDVISSYGAVDGELHADDYTDVSSYRPIVYMEAMITNNNDSTLESFGGLPSRPPNRQNKFPAKISGHTVYSFN